MKGNGSLEKVKWLAQGDKTGLEVKPQKTIFRPCAFTIDACHLFYWFLHFRFSAAHLWPLLIRKRPYVSIWTTKIAFILVLPNTALTHSKCPSLPGVWE